LGAVFLGLVARLRKKLSDHSFLLFEISAFFLDGLLHLDDVAHNLIWVQIVKLLDTDSDLGDILRARLDRTTAVIKTFVQFFISVFTL